MASRYLQTASRLPMKLYGELATGSQGNVIFSPHCIQNALSILLLGCHGNSRTELLALFDGDETYHEQNVHVARSLRTSSGAVELKNASRLFVEMGYELVEKFTSDCFNFYGSEVGRLHFRNDPGASADHINDWVMQQTNGKIRNLINEDNISQDTKVILVTATYFKGTWDKQFEPYFTRKQDFYVSHSVNKAVDMMVQEEDFAFRLDQNLGAKLLKLNYRGHRVSMVIVLPQDQFGLSEVEKKLTPEHLGNLDHMTTVKLRLPKFRIDFSCDLETPLIHLGVSTIFKSGSAGLTGISGSSDLYVSSIRHKAFIEVDEIGTEAAAATDVTMDDCMPPERPPPMEFFCDHPFLFVIKHNQTNTVLFTGKYTGPSKTTDSY